MSTSSEAWLIALASTLVSAGAGLAAATIVSRVTQAPGLRYMAYSAALVLSPIPVLFGLLIACAPDASIVVQMTKVPIAALPVGPSLHAPRAAWMLASGVRILMAAYAVGASFRLFRLAWKWMALGRLLRASWPVDAAAIGLGGVALAHPGH